MVEGDFLPPAVLRGIGDKLYDKRKQSALEVEQIIKRLALQNDQHRIRLIIDKLISDYAFSALANHRKVWGRALARRCAAAGFASCFGAQALCCIVVGAGGGAAVHGGEQQQ